MNKIICADCMEILPTLKSGSIDLVITDPPYDIKNVQTGNNSEFSRSFQKMNDEIKSENLTGGVSLDFCKEILRLQNKVNAYIWCNKSQILPYLKFFVEENGCAFDILVWRKTNAVPTFNNKYLSDKEYCLYFRRGGYCNPPNYNQASTVFETPINVEDKKKWKHPTIKPLGIIKTLVENSSKVGDTILDMFCGSGTTAIASLALNRNYLCIEKSHKWAQIANERIAEYNKQFTLF